jgi:transcription initiation factor IIF auxiliary subunit
MRTKIYFDLYFKTRSFAVSEDVSSSGSWSELKDDLKATTLEESEKAKIRLIKKDEIKKLLGRSPDFGDAAALAALPAGEYDAEQARRDMRAGNPFSRR